MKRRHGGTFSGFTRTEVSVEPSLVYVYTGNSLPSYGAHSLRIARKHHSGSVILLSDTPQNVPGITTVDIRDWYDPGPFEEFRALSPLDPYFRGGFWLRAAERFFVLDQYMAHSRHTRLFHVELDVMVLDLAGYASYLDSFGLGIFAPMEVPSKALASLLYVNSPSALEELTDYTISHAHLGNEMEILGHFITEYPRIGHSLVSDQVFDRDRWPFAPSTVSPDHGLVDAAAFGLWLFGWDPRNSDRSMWNHRKPDFIHHDMQAVRFDAPFFRRELWAKTDHSGPFLVRTLHIHSKIFGRLRVWAVLRFHAWVAQFRWRTLVIPRFSSVFAWVLNFALSLPMSRLWAIAPRWIRRVVGGLLEPTVDWSPRRLSNRQRLVMNNLLRGPRLKGQSPAVSVLINAVGRTSAEIGETLQAIEQLDNRVEHITVIKESGGVLAVCIEHGKNYLGCSTYPDVSDVRFREEYDSASAEEKAQWHLMREAFNARTEFVLVCTAGYNWFCGGVSLSRDRKLPLFVDHEKHTPAARHAAEFFHDEAISERWSFDPMMQMIDVDALKEMFRGDMDQINRWFIHGIAPGAREVSALGSYTQWFNARHKKKTMRLAKCAK